MSFHLGRPLQIAPVIKIINALKWDLKLDPKYVMFWSIYCPIFLFAVFVGVSVIDIHLVHHGIAWTVDITLNRIWNS